ncbi:NADPH2 dehydrogenase, partial [Phenoliferia sp. Uapishka_3]
MSNTLFTPIKIGDIELQHRVAMAPLTRMRAHESHVHSGEPRFHYKLRWQPSWRARSPPALRHSERPLLSFTLTPLPHLTLNADIATEYYTQRASTPGTLIISEGCFLSPSAGGYGNVPGIWNSEQAAAWKKIVAGVHEKKSFMYMQMWALGRVAVPDELKKFGGGDLISSSDVPFDKMDKPRPLTIEEMGKWKSDYAAAAKRFVEEAGGDGVEIHCANGYLLDQFLQTNSNTRTDAYGGSVENRLRFPLEVVEAVVNAVGASKVGVRISPFNSFQGMKMPQKDIIETFGAYAKELKSRFPELAYLHAVEPRSILGVGEVTPGEGESLDFLFDIWGSKPFLAAGELNRERAFELCEKHPNAVSVWGRMFISNPDLPERIKTGAALTPYDRATFYNLGPEAVHGYTDYPFLGQGEYKP